MKYLFFLGHPAHFHLFKNTIHELNDADHEVQIVIKTKDILEDLLEESGLKYKNLLSKERSDGILGILKSLSIKNYRLLKYCIKNKPDMLIGSAAEVAHIGFLLNIPRFNFNEDDYSVIKKFALITFPFTSNIISPESCNNGKWDKKTISYKGFHKLAYLHPNWFRPDVNVVAQYLDINKPYFLIRLAKLNAHHDKNIDGINDNYLKKLIAKLESHGNILLSTERKLPEELEKYCLKFNPNDIHHLLSHAKLFIGDSQSMTVESAMLGTPSIRISSLSGKINVLEELEHEYQLTVGIQPDKIEESFDVLDELLSNKKLKDDFNTRRDRMIKEKIDVTAFFIWFMDSFPASLQELNNNPERINSFK